MVERARHLDNLRRVVIKVGTSVLADERLKINLGFLAWLAQQTRQLRQRGHEILVVTSGAIAAGRHHLNMSHSPRNLAEKQAAAAVGQIHLMRHYSVAFENEGLDIAQILLTHGDFQNRRRFLNARQTLLNLLSMGVVPLVNENDTTSVEEILVGDNDNLSALVTVLVDADLLLMLSDVEGVFTADPNVDSTAQRLSLVEDIEDAMKFASGTQNPGSTGGMLTKLEAARYAGAYGVPSVIASGEIALQLTDVVDGHDVGTLVVPQTKLNRRKHWIGHTLKPQGTIFVDAGAAKAIRSAGKSLLPAGIERVEGHFGPGDPVDIVDPNGVAFARGLTSYGAEDVERLKGLKSTEIATTLGYKTQDEVIHRDHLVMLGDT